ncbi:MAG: TadE/TadG family type IV pilus assembly protein [Ruminiclostridium sp.]|nr:TadE/TadG family type IV pilus assembly protein [Ruminiclostridium sp.]
MTGKTALYGQNAHAINTKKYQRGSATVEAAIVLPILMIAFISVLTIIRIAVTYERMQQAVNQVAGQMSQYSYLYTVSGLKEQHDNLNNAIDDAKEELANQQNVLSTFYNEMQGLTENVSQIGNNNSNALNMNTINDLINIASDASSATEAGEELAQQIENLIIDPMNEIRLIGLALSDTLFGKGKTMLFGSISKSMIKRNLANDMQIDVSHVDESLRIVDGINELDISCSTFLEDNETIDLIVEYKVKPVPDFIFFPEIRLRNRACVLAWTWGIDKIEHDEPEIGTVDSIWNIDKSKNFTGQHFGRGNKVDKWYAEELKEGMANAETTPYHFKTIDLIKYAKENSYGELYTIFSLNPFLPTYQKKSEVLGEIKKNIYKLYEFEKYETKSLLIDVKGLEKKYKRIVYVIIPENTELPEPYRAAFEECTQIAKKLGIELRQAQKYGEYQEAAGNESE